jgi:hypothetical protein
LLLLLLLLRIDVIVFQNLKNAFVIFYRNIKGHQGNSEGPLTLERDLIRHRIPTNKGIDAVVQQQPKYTLLSTKLPVRAGAVVAFAAVETVVVISLRRIVWSLVVANAIQDP